MSKDDTDSVSYLMRVTSTKRSGFDLLLDGNPPVLTVPYGLIVFAVRSRCALSIFMYVVSTN